ncbi:Nitrilase-like protein 2 [Diplonema papillatum]|nr:Nitrilase-like protein 2 [Diplonema papillatum]
MAAKTVRIGVGQLCVTANRRANLDIVQRLTAEAARKGCAMVFFPENVDFIAPGLHRTLEMSEVGLDSATMAEYQRTAKRHKIWIDLGGIHEKLPDADMLANTQVVIDDKGAVRAVYRKAHLFDVAVPGGKVYKESNSTIPGTQYAMVDTPCGRIGLTTCYDVRFPHLYEALSKEGDADIITVPSAFMVPTGKAHWHALLRARAIDTQAFIIAPAQSGWHNDARESFGHSLVVDPWGTVLLDMEKQQNVLGVIDLDFSVLNKTRMTLPIKQHLRTLTWGPSGPPPRKTTIQHLEKSDESEAEVL